VISSPNIAVKIYSITGALVADYYSNVHNNNGLSINLQVIKVGGLDTFSFTLANNFKDPLFNDMECRFFVDGVHWYSGYAEKIPELDSSTAEVVVEGRGFYHKLKDVIVNETYTAQTFDYILKDICSSYLGNSLNVLYDVAKISSPTITGIDVEFKDKKLFDVIYSLLKIANYNYQTTQYRFWVDKNKYFNFGSISTTNKATLFEGYHYQHPEVQSTRDKLINKVKAYRTTSADDNKVELVSIYSDADSISNYGEVSKKVTFPDYLNSDGIKNIADGIIDKYKEPITKVNIVDYPISTIQDIGFYRLINKRFEHYTVVAKMESLTDWDVSNLNNTTASVSTTEVFTNRTSLKLVTDVGSATDYMELIISPVLRFPTLFKLFAYKTVASSQFTVRLFDTFGNSIDIEVGHNNEPIDEWISYTVEINLELGHALLYVDYDSSNGSLLRVDKDVSNYGNFKIDWLLRDGLLNLSKVQIIVDSNTVGTSYFDQFQVLSSLYKEHTLMLETINYNLEKSSTAELNFGDIPDNIVEEIIKGNKDGENALSIFSKA